MTPDCQSDENATLTVALPLAASTLPGPAKTVEIVRVESELLAIDQLMADLSDDSVAAS